MKRLSVLAAGLALLVVLPSRAATRLPREVSPSHYTISITPNLVAETYSGEETIDVNVGVPVDSITLHAVDLALRDVSVVAGNRTLPATTTADAPNETVTLHVTEAIPAGPAQVHIRFDGTLNTQLRGLYLSKTAKRKYAVTQFEATSARRAFPCFDEPAMKATYDITLIVDAGDTAISNGTIVSDTKLDGGKHALRFSRTQKMSTYLVAMLVGDFQCIEGQSRKTPIRVCTTPGLQNLGHFALEAAQASLSFYEDYYGIPYPFGKLDLIGIPDFAAGAMENAGAITFRETDLLADERTASVLAEKRVAEVVTHEIAHQWFGDLVTMQWWNDIWLNEGFATFMSQKPIAAWKPEWREELDRPAGTNEALRIDAGLSTVPIRTPSTGDNFGFSNAGIVYDKTASVLRMVEEWIGRDAFRDAIRAYLRKYAWGNAAAEDFWASMKASSSQPTDVVLESFIDRVGVPFLHETATCDAGVQKLTLTEDRLLPAIQSAPAQTWTIPICAHVVGGEETPCALISAPSQIMTVTAACDRPLFLSRNGSGYFVVDYPAATRQALRARLGDMRPEERISFHGTEWLLVRTGHRDIGEYMAMLRAMPRPAERQIVTAMVDNLISIDQRLVTDADRAAWRAFVHDVLRGQAAVTWDAVPNETPDQRIARASVLWALGMSGDAQVVAGARTVALRYMDDPSSVDAMIADRALHLSATFGDSAFFDRVVAKLESAPTPELAGRYRNLLPLFRDPAVMPKAIDYIYSDRIRTQDVGQVASAMFSDPATRPAAWTALQSHWDALQKRAPSTAARVSGAFASFCDPESRKNVEAFFTEHKSRRDTSERALEAIDTCIAFRNAQEKSFEAALAPQK